MCVDVRETSSSNCLHTMSEADSSISEHAIKVRKPYIITKQRERWTEEEHNKFLEALKQYGRAWRRIEEHIGSKNTVQIRSHAQKFFSKVARESSNNSTGTNSKPIEIPPPRPKRRPSHPYPRKVGYLSNKKDSFVDEHLWSFMPKQSVSEQESKSPTSVLTPFESDTIGSACFDPLKPCLSPASSADRSLTIEEMLSEQGSGSKLSSPDVSTMASDLEIQEPGNSKEAPVRITSLKLFGRTVIVSGLEKEDSENQESLSDCSNIDPETRKQREEDGGGGEGEINPFMAYCFPSHKNLISHMEHGMVPFPTFWAFYGGSTTPFGFSSSPSSTLDQSQLQSTYDKIVNGSCQTGSSITSCSDDVVQMEESLPQTVAPEPSKNSVLGSSKPSSANSNRGFMPYKRCVVKTELNRSSVACAERRNLDL